MAAGDTAKEAVPRVLGRYALYGEFARGGMATVHFGRRLGPSGFALTVAIKRLHPRFAGEPEIAASLLDEARLASRIRHPNVVSILDVVALDEELFLVMDYIAGESLARLLAAANERGERMPAPILVGVMIGVLHGLHAAHEAKSDHGEPLSLVHRDVSLRNVLVGVDGVARLVDFGIAKAVGRVQTTREGEFKGTLGYSPPEQILRQDVDRRADVYAASVVLFWLLTGRAPFEGDEASLLYDVLHGDVPAPSTVEPAVSRAMDRVVARGLARRKEDRFETALAMADALEEVAAPATPREIGRWVERFAADGLRRRAERLARVERASPRELGDFAETAGGRAGTTATDAGVEAAAVPLVEVAPARARSASRTALWAAAVVIALSGAAVGGALRSPVASSIEARAGLREASMRVSPHPLDSAAAPPVVPVAAAPESAGPVASVAPRPPRAGAAPAPRSRSPAKAPADRSNAPRRPEERDYGF